MLTVVFKIDKKIGALFKKIKKLVHFNVLKTHFTLRSNCFVYPIKDIRASTRLIKK